MFSAGRPLVSAQSEAESDFVQQVRRHRTRPFRRFRRASLHGLSDHAPEWSVFQHLTADPRVTPTGRILRRLSLDELP